jgi:hypothetical protein
LIILIRLRDETQKKIKNPSFSVSVTVYENRDVPERNPLAQHTNYEKPFHSQLAINGMPLSLFVLCSHRASGMTARLE